jgi:hypothetical protein
MEVQNEKNGTRSWHHCGRCLDWDRPSAFAFGFTRLGNEFVPGTPGFPGIATGVEESFVDPGGTAAAAWSATTLFGDPLDVC